MKVKKENPINTLKDLEARQKDLKRELEKIYKEIKVIAERLKIDPPNITETTEEVLDLREKIMRVKEIKAVLDKYKIPIEQVAFLHCWYERIADCELWTIPIPGSKINSYAIQSKVIMDPHSNKWSITQRYLYGGPGSSMKVFFDKHRFSQSAYDITFFLSQ
jgi:uncharacterized protein with GYD domain